MYTETIRKILEKFIVDYLVAINNKDFHGSFLCLSDIETSEKIQASGILQLFASLLTPQSSCTAKVANIIAEVAKNGEVFLKNLSVGIIFSFIS